MVRTLMFVAGLLAAAPLYAQDGDTTVAVIGRDGKSTGNVVLSPAAGGVLLRADLVRLPAGVHGFHIHETGACDAAGGFESAGGHFAPGGSDHGFLTDGGPHAGDMPNQRAAEDGTLQGDIYNGRVTLDDGEAGIRGRALILHAGADDYTSQPSGDAGERLACGVIE